MELNKQFDGCTFGNPQHCALKQSGCRLYVLTPFVTAEITTGRRDAVPYENKTVAQMNNPVFNKPRLFIYTNLLTAAKMRVVGSPPWREVSGGSA